MNNAKKLLSSDFFAQLQSAQDLLAERLGICLVLVDEDGNEITLPSGLPLVCHEHELPRYHCPEFHRELIERISATQEYAIATCPYGQHLAALVTSIRSDEGALYLLAGSTQEREPTESDLELLRAIYTLPLESPFPGRKPTAMDRNPASGRSALTLQERRVLAYMVSGLPNKDIANRLCISQSTVKAHVTSILKKLNLSNRTEACAYALKNGIQLGDQSDDWA